MNILWENIIYKNDHNKMECFKHVFKKKFVKTKKKPNHNLKFEMLVFWKQFCHWLFYARFKIVWYWLTKIWVLEDVILYISTSYLQITIWYWNASFLKIVWYWYIAWYWMAEIWTTLYDYCPRDLSSVYSDWHSGYTTLL